MMSKFGCVSNAILKRLPDSEFNRLAPRMSLVNLKSGEVILRVGSKGGRMYFPLDCVISMVCSMKNGHEAEIVGVGSEGAVGMFEAIDGEVSQHEAKVVVSGYAACLPTDGEVDHIIHEESFKQLAYKYMRAHMQLSQLNTACARFHGVKEQLAKWLLLSMDRHKSGEMKLTHATLSQALGVRRESVTAVAGEFRRLGWVDYSRGCFSVLNRRALEEQACECYGQSKALLSELHNAKLIAASL